MPSAHITLARRYQHLVSAGMTPKEAVDRLVSELNGGVWIVEPPLRGRYLLHRTECGGLDIETGGVILDGENFICRIKPSMLDPVFLLTPHQQAALDGAPDSFDPRSFVKGQPEPVAVNPVTRLIAELLQHDPLMTKEVCLAKCRETFPDVTQNAFQTEFWPDGRELAGLPRKGEGGRPSKKMKK